jgi:thiamine pyrophosphate-dependent acetolactate synthase large subunit-like protein
LIDAEGGEAAEDQKTMLKNLQNRRETASKEYEARSDWISNIDDNAAPEKPTYSKPRAKTILDMIDKSILELQQLSRDAAYVSDDVFANAKEIEKKQKKNYDRFTVVSAFLYSAGWLIGVLGQIVGLEPAEG